jgi:hypothetical protein
MTQDGINIMLKRLAHQSQIRTTGRIRFHNIRKWVMSGLSRAGFNEFQIKYVLGKSIPMSDATYLQTLELEVREKYPKAYESYLNLNPEASPKVVSELSKDLQEKTARIEELEKQIQYFKSPDFAKELIKGIHELGEPMKIDTKAIEPTEIKKIPKNDMEQFMELRKKGYVMTYENDTYLIMEKD